MRYSFRSVEELERRIRDLAADEQRCCSFLRVDVSRDDEVVWMTVAAPPEAQDALRFVFSA